MRILNLVVLLACAQLSMSAYASGMPDRGRFVVKPPRVESAEWRAEARAMQDSGTLQELAGALNEIFVLPRDVSMRYAECGEANAYYDSERYEIQMCLELMQDIADSLEGQYEDEDLADAAAGAYIATVLHEAGHALVHVLEIPVTGREEDAVDQLAAWMLIEADDVDSVLGVAATYYSENNEEVGDEDYGDEHSLDKQRYFNMVCWAYGSDPDNSQELIDVWELPTARAEQCVDEYAQLDRSWTRLLSDNLRDEDSLRDEETSAPAPRRGTPRGSPTPSKPTQSQDGPIVGRVKYGTAPVDERERRYQKPDKD
jgi:Putative metallopeptidase